MSQFYSTSSNNTATTAQPATRELAVGLGSLLRLLATNDRGQRCADYSQATSFYHRNKPTFDLCQYAERLVDMLGVSLECFVIAASYFGRLKCLVTDFTAHRIMLAAVVVAAKTHDDRRPPMAYLAEVGGVEKDELVLLEKELLCLLEFRTHVDMDRYERAADILERAVNIVEMTCRLEQLSLRDISTTQTPPVLDNIQTKAQSLVSDQVKPTSNNDDDADDYFGVSPDTPPTFDEWQSGDSNTSITSTATTSSTSSWVSMLTHGLGRYILFQSEE